MEGDEGGRESQATPRTELSRRKSKSQLFILHIMTHLGEHSQKRIEKEIRRSGGVVDMIDFVHIMKEELMADFRSSESGFEGFGSDEELVENLCELFKCIDINGDGTLEWSEFTSFVIEKAKTYDKLVDLGNTPPYVVVDSPKSKEGATFRTYSIQGNVKVLLGTGLGEADYDVPLRFVHYIKQLDALVTLRQKSSIVRIHDVMDSSEIGRFKESGCPISVEYIPSTAMEVTTKQTLSTGISAAKVGCLAVTNDNSTINVRDLSPGSKQFGSICSMSTPHPQVSLAWNCRHRLLVSSSTAGLIHTWDVATREEKSCFFAHEDIAAKVICIEDLDMVISAGMDSLVCSWDLYSGSQQAEYYGHKRGVEYLSYNPTHKLIFSGGVDHDALVWSPFSPSLLYKLRGHNDCLIGIETFPNFPHQLLTADESGFFKIWDVRTFKCLQTFSCERAKVNAFALCPGNMEHTRNAFTNGAGVEDPGEDISYFSSNYISRIAACTKTITFIDQKNPIEKMITDDFPVVVALFNAEMLTILTASGRSVRVWDALTGKLKSTFKDVATSDITAMCIDDRKRKFLLGTHDGTIRVYNCANGVEMKSMTPHDAEVSSLLYMGADKLVISTSWDKRIIVHSELEDKCKVVREMDNLDFHTDDIVTCDYSKSLGYIATGSLDRYVCVWLLDLGKLHGRVQHNASITAVKFFGDAPIVIASDAEGVICFWRLHKAPISYECLHSYQCVEVNESEVPAVESKSHSAAMIHAFDYSHKIRRVVIGDENGTLRALHVDFDEEKETIDTSVTWIVARAHQDGILFTQIPDAAEWILTSGQDRCVKIFDMNNGDCLGVLIDGAGIGSHRSEFWHVPFDVQGILEEKQRSIEHLFRRSKENAGRRATLNMRSQRSLEVESSKDESKEEPITPRTHRRNIIKSILQNT